jgi:2-polyprenyl-6-methoxyphenol hydroxylase-like FAD-dependent oxidoreductase
MHLLPHRSGSPPIHESKNKLATSNQRHSGGTLLAWMAADHNTDVLIVGAGPTGLVLALWLARAGVRLRIIDKTAEPGTTSRALAVQARTLEFYQQLGFADAVVAAGRKMLAANFWVRGKRAAHVILGEMGKGISPFSYALIYPQDEHERLLIDLLREAGVEVERQTELLRFQETADGITGQIRHADGREEPCTAAYIAGCDGARSTVREALAIGFPGGTYEHLFYVADVDASGQTMNGELHVALDKTDFLVVFPLKSDRRARLIGTIRQELEQRQEKLTWDDVSKRVIEWIRIDVERVNWFSTYRVHHRVAGQFRQGRIFLLGDAAHIHSPVGGQGMNTGIGDAVNLAWKLAAVLQGRAHASVLDSYEQERIGFARELVKTTDQAFTSVTSSGWMARLVRLRLAPLAIPVLLSSAAVRRIMFRRVSQTAIDYEGSNLSTGWTETVQGGDRLPWIRNADGEGQDNFAPLRSLDWQVHVYGDATKELRELCAQRGLPLHVYAWRKQMQCTGVWRNAVYLVRPDGYVGLADAAGSAAAIASYLDARGIRIAH